MMYEDERFILYYVTEDGEVVLAGENFHWSPYLEAWLDDMVTSNPDTIFFCAVPSTDIFNTDTMTAEWGF
jgi:hypothetical protein